MNGKADCHPSFETLTAKEESFSVRNLDKESSSLLGWNSPELEEM
jgi:hypothetical protein